MARPALDLPPRRQHPAWIFLSAVRQLRGMAIPLIVLLVGGGRRGDEAFLIFGGVAVLLGLAARGVAWWQFRYEVSGGELRVRSGLLARRERFVPLERIQAVDVNETPLQ
ncbi:MAG: PH domain-containing protein, partial [Chloroflexota bacterium]|nr:PH domain-containing protein [Chloroflexota bacterium]